MMAISTSEVKLSPDSRFLVCYQFDAFNGPARYCCAVPAFSTDSDAPPLTLQYRFGTKICREPPCGRSISFRASRPRHYAPKEILDSLLRTQSQMIVSAIQA